MMRFLLVNQFYPPDMAPTGQHLHDLARCLAARGHEVEVLCSRRSYDGGGRYAARELVDGVAVTRLSTFGFGRRGVGRAADYLSFHLAVAAYGLRWPESCDVTLSLTTPPYVGWVIPRAPRWSRAAHAHWVMDLYPDVLAAHGSLWPATLRYRVLARLARAQMARLSLVLSLGPRMQEKVAAYVSGRTRLAWVPLWGTSHAVSEPAAVAAMRQARGWGAGDCVFLYSGNMGLGHRLDEFLAASERLADQACGRPALWAFAGGGVRRAEVEAFVLRHPTARVQLLPYVPQAELGASLAAADVHLISLRDEWKGLIMPSKLQAAFASARPVVFVGPRDCETADWVVESGGGWVVAEGDVDGLLRAVSEASDPAERRRRGEAGVTYARTHFDRATNTARVADLLETCASPSGKKLDLRAQAS
jgi:glycosyltransferase involved in cell wall biosynthesis